MDRKDSSHVVIEGIIYVVFPYPFNLANLGHVIDRTQMARKWCFELLGKGFLSICPNLHHHVISTTFGIDESSWTEMRQFVVPLMNSCDALHVLMMPGWEESLVVKDCINHAKTSKKTIVYVNTEPLQEWLAAFQTHQQDFRGNPVGGPDVQVRPVANRESVSGRLSKPDDAEPVNG